MDDLRSKALGGAKNDVAVMIAKLKEELGKIEIDNKLLIAAKRQNAAAGSANVNVRTKKADSIRHRIEVLEELMGNIQ